MSPSRRRLLRSALSGIAVAVAGCAGSSNREPTGTDSGSGSTDGPAPRSGTVTDPPVRKPRNPGGGPVLREAAAGDDGEAVGIGREVITEGSRVEELTFGAGVPEAAAESARDFLAGTDFDGESVFYSPSRTDSCERYRIRGASWEPTRVDYRYCRELRPPDGPCEADARDTVGILIRLPVTFSRRISGSGSSGRASCAESDTEYGRIEGNATVPGPRAVTGSGGSDTPGEKP